MTKQLFLKVFMVSFLLLGTITTYAQVRIGGDTAPATGAILDLKGGAYNGGLLLPSISITDLSKIPSGSFTDISSDQDTNTALTGLLVYNTNTATGIVPGVYFWDGSSWKLITPTAN